MIWQKDGTKKGQYWKRPDTEKGPVPIRVGIKKGQNQKGPNTEKEWYQKGMVIIGSDQKYHLLKTSWLKWESAKSISLYI